MTDDVHPHAQTPSAADVSAAYGVGARRAPRTAAHNRGATMNNHPHQPSDTPVPPADETSDVPGAPAVPPGEGGAGDGPRIIDLSQEADPKAALEDLMASLTEERAGEAAGGGNAAGAPGAGAPGAGAPGAAGVAGADAGLADAGATQEAPEPVPSYPDADPTLTPGAVLGTTPNSLYSLPIVELTSGQVQVLLEDQLDQHRRALADYKNLNRRRQDEVTKARARGAAAFAGGLIEMLDNFDLAMKAVRTSADSQMSKGVEMVYNQLHAALAQGGMHEVPGVGATFDPQVHEAIAMEEDGQEREDPEVIEVMRPGWMFQDQLLRAATVRVVQ